MTESEAINDIRNRECIECIGNEIGCGSCAYKMAINALEKRIPMKVFRSHNSDNPEDIQAFGDKALFGYCPECGRLQVDVWNHSNCGDCGQALDWSE